MQCTTDRRPPASGAELFALLAGLDARFRALDTPLPDEAPPVEVWAGVLFRIRERLFLAPLEQIAEVLEPPADITPLPGTKPWVLGVANNRGTLLPIFDFAALVYGGMPARRDSDRILVVRQEESPCGLMVAEAIGIRHFEASSRGSRPPAGSDLLTGFAESTFDLDGVQVPVLAMDRLMADPLLNAAFG
jgi:twitching motility protein PilI